MKTAPIDASWLASRLAIGLALTLLAAASAGAAPAHFWFSLSATDPLQHGLGTPLAPQVNLRQCGTQTLHLWARPQDDLTLQLQTLRNISLDIKKDPSIAIDSFEFNNPNNRFGELVDTGPGNQQTVMINSQPFTYPLATSSNPPNPPFTRLERLMAFTVTPSTTAGIGAGTPGSVPTPDGPAWLLATMQVRATGSSGTAGLSLEIGHASITHIDPANPVVPVPTDIRFGAASDPIHDSATNRNPFVPGPLETPDATFNLSPLIPGDVNGDGVVDLLDLDIIGFNFGLMPATRCEGDLNGDGKVDLLDLDILGSTFGNSGSLSVPEPAALPLAVLLVGALAATAGRLGGRRPALLCVGLAASCLAAPRAEAVQLNANWLGGAGLWNDAGQWSTPNFPDNGADTYAVTIDAASSVVVLTNSVMIDSLTLDDDTSFLSVNNLMSVLGSVQVDSGTLILNSTLNAVGLQNTGGVVAGGGILEVPGGTFVNSASLRPGSGSIDGLVMEGDYIQTASGVFEAQLNGLAPGTEHDVFEVVGGANLAGRIDLPISSIATFPIPGQSVTVLTSNSLSGAFNSFRVTGLPPNVAQQIVYDAFDVDVNFVGTTSTGLANLGGFPGLWDSPATWDNGVPDSTTIVSVVNDFAGPPNAVVVSAPAEAHRVDVNGTNDVFLSISGVPLSVSTSTNIGTNATMILGGGTQLTSETVTISDGGVLTGEGTIISDVEVGVDAGAQAVFDPAGVLGVQGDYTQGPDGLFAAEVSGAPGDAANDLVTVLGDVDLSGALEIDLTNLPDAELTIGDEYELLRYSGALSGTFDTIDLVGRNELRAVINYQDTSTVDGLMAASYRIVCRGDLENNGLDPVDARAFAAVLLNQDLNPFVDPVTGKHFNANWPGFFDYESGFNSNGRVDFYDVPLFAECYAKDNNMSLAEAYAVLDEAFQAVRHPVPEPITASLALLAALGLAAFGRTR